MLACVLAVVLSLPVATFPAERTATEPRSVDEPHGLSVYRIRPARDTTLIAVASAVTLLPYAFASSIEVPRCPCDPNEVNRFDRGVIGNSSEVAEVASDVTVSLVVLLPVVLDALDLGLSRPFGEDLVVFVETLAIDTALVSLVKAIVQRPLPLVYAGLSPKLEQSPAGYRSFYSGHTSLAFAALSAVSVTLELRYGAGVWPWVATVALGTSVALERVAAGRHFYTDVLVGAGTGILIGAGVPLLHRLPKTERSIVSWTLLPTGSGLLLSARF